MSAPTLKKLQPIQRTVRGEWKDAGKSLVREGAGVLTHAIFPGLTPIVESVQRTEAMHRAAVLGVATYRYQAQYGRPPSEFGDLSPEFVNIIPRDPFDGEQMRFKLTDQQFVIYGVGPDLVDDGGIPFNGPNQPGDIRFVVALDSGTTDNAPPQSDEPQNNRGSESPNQ